MGSATAMERKPHLSPSSLAMLSKCGQQYAYRYVDGLVLPPNAAIIRGKAMHKGQRATLANKISFGELLADDAVADVAADAFDGEWGSSEVALNEDEMKDGMAVVKGKAKDTAVGLATFYNRIVAPDVKPESVERKLSLEIEGFPFDLLGYADVIETDKTVRDAKTTGKLPNESLIQDSIQAEVYPAAIEAIDGVRPKHFVLDVLVEQKTQRQAVTMVREVAPDNATLFMRLESAAQTVVSGSFMPADPSWWGCSAKWCGYWSRCPYGAAQRSAPVAIHTHKEKRDDNN